MKATAATEAKGTGMRNYARQQTRTLLRRLAYQVSQTARNCEADSVHDLRVAIRRFTQCLRVFEPYFPEGEGAKIRHKLKAIMQAASAVRDRDIAMDILRKAGIPQQSKMAAALHAGRKQAERDLLKAIRRSSRNNFSRKWRERLEL